MLVMQDYFPLTQVQLEAKKQFFEKKDRKSFFYR